MAERHRYRLPDGTLAVNVTAVAGLLDDGKSAAMAGAAAKLTRQGLTYRAEWNAKRDAGTRAHAVCEAWLKGEAAFVADEDAGFVDALEKFWIEKQPEMIECEAIVLSQHGYGGRFDMITKLGDGRTLLIDLKSGKRHPVEHTLQLAAYRYADGIAVYDDDGSLAHLRAMPTVEGCACVYVSADGTYELVEYPAGDVWFGHFLSLLSVRQETRGEAMATLVKAAKAKKEAA